MRVFCLIFFETLPRAVPYTSIRHRFPALLPLAFIPLLEDIVGPTFRAGDLIESLECFTVDLVQAIIPDLEIETVGLILTRKSQSSRKAFITEIDEYPETAPSTGRIVGASTAAALHQTRSPL